MWFAWCWFAVNALADPPLDAERARCRLASGHPTEARELARGVLVEDPSDPVARSVYLATSPQAAHAELAMLGPESDPLADTRRQLAQIHSERGDWAMVRAWRAHAREHPELLRPLWAGGSDAAPRDPRVDRAMDRMTRPGALRSRPSVVVLRLRGLVGELQTGRVVPAIQEDRLEGWATRIDDALSVRGEGSCPPARRLRAKDAQRMAEELARQDNPVVDLDHPDHAFAVSAKLFAVLREQGRNEEAMAVARAMQPRTRRPEPWLWEAEAHDPRGHPEAAAGAAREAMVAAVASWPEDPEIHDVRFRFDVLEQASRILRFATEELSGEEGPRHARLEGLAAHAVLVRDDPWAFPGTVQSDVPSVADPRASTSAEALALARESTDPAEVERWLAHALVLRWTEGRRAELAQDVAAILGARAEALPDREGAHLDRVVATWYTERAALDPAARAARARSHEARGELSAAFESYTLAWLFGGPVTKADLERVYDGLPGQTMARAAFVPTLDQLLTVPTAQLSRLVELTGRYLEVEPLAHSVWEVHVYARTLSGDHEGVLQRYDQILAEADCALPALYVNKGDLLRRMGRFSEEAAQYRKALQCDPGEPFAQLNLALIEARTGNSGQALVHLMRARRRQGRDPFVSLTAGMVHALLGEPEPALEWLGQAVAQRPVAPLPALDFRLTLEQEPALDSLRGLPAFQALLAELDAPVDP